MNVAKKNIQKNIQSLFSDSGLVKIDLASDSAELDMTAEERKLLKEHPYEIFTSMKKGLLE